MNQDAAFKQKQQEELEKVEQREAMAKSLIQQRQKQEEEKRLMMREAAAIKEEIRKQDQEQRKRREKYSRDQMLQRIERDEKRTLEERQRRKMLMLEKGKMWTKNNNDRLVLSTMTNEFEKTGELKLPPTASKGFEELVKTKGVPFDGEDRNPGATQVECGVTITGVVEKGQAVTFKAFVEKAKMVKFETNKSGVAMYVGNGEVSNPSRRSNVWSKGNKFSIFHVEKAFMLGWFYITIEGTSEGETDFHLTVSWQDSDSLNLSAVSTIAPVSREDDGLEDENKVIARCKERMDMLLEKKLAERGAQFAEKFKELFPGSKP